MGAYLRRRSIFSLSMSFTLTNWIGRLPHQIRLYHILGPHCHPARLCGCYARHVSKWSPCPLPQLQDPSLQVQRPLFVVFNPYSRWCAPQDWHLPFTLDHRKLWSYHDRFYHHILQCVHHHRRVCQGLQIRRWPPSYERQHLL